MFKIGEFSKLVRVSPRMLRYYEQNGLLMPAEVDRFTGYRMYTVEQMPLLSRITQLRDMGFGVDEIKALLPNYTDRAVMREAVSRKQTEIQGAIAAEHIKLKKIAAISGRLMEVNMIYDIELKSFPAEKVLSLREIVPTPEREPELWEKLAAYVKERKIDAAEVGYSIYHDEDYKETDVDIEIAVTVSKFGTSEGNYKFTELPAIPSAATVRFSGSYEGYNEAIEKLVAWVESNGYTMSGQVRGLAIKSYANCENETDFLTELQVPVAKA
jgi:effector-binding domain-containing protein